ncbi:hypothetical protein BDZ94DRAFT_82627 [Collybia nuda]|uniref:F-box domain-containing protein n=1 Tax=Collybia nuda TaxID=64659 RepID=A0A9P5XXL2_9AGAR|nr:hypothetical protein BDZ94DRAFT_82627 [Collybia nuda]
MDASYQRAQLELAEAELYTLDFDLAVLLAKRSRLVRRISQYRASLAPCNKLPSELIIEIIKLNMPELQPLPLVLGKLDPRLQITQICSHWRRAAFGLNKLWDSVRLNVCDRSSPIKLIAAWFRQCSSGTFTLKISGFSKDFDTDCLFEELLIPYSSRIVSLSSILMNANHFSATAFDILESLRLTHAPRKVNIGEPMIAPLLRHFEVTGITRNIDNRLIELLPRVPWRQLTSIHLTGWFNFSNICDILVHCHSLEDCQIDTVSGISPDVDHPLVELPRLKSLWIKFGSAVLYHELFSFVAPGLTSLSVNHPPQIPITLKKFSAFINTFISTLRHLEITKNPFDYLPAAPTLQVTHMPQFVTQLTSKEFTIDLGTLARIGTGELLPDLEVLEFLAADRTKIENIADALIPKQSSKTPRLKDVYIHTGQRFCSGERLGELHSQGINIWAVYRYPHVEGTGVGGAVGTWTLV